MELTDTHCHLDLEQFDADRETVLERAAAAGVTRMLVPGLDMESSRGAVELALSDSKVFAAVGVHPNEAGKWEDGTAEDLKALAIPRPNPSPRGRGAKVVAIGEIGLDYYWKAAPRGVQQRVLREQLNLAKELSLPVVVHMREENDAADGDCSRDLLKILEQWVASLSAALDPLVERPGVLHSFSGSLDPAERAIELGFCIGVTGPITFKNADARRRIVRQLPLSKLLIETDAPYLAPMPHRGKRNEPAFVRYIADKIAEVHGITPEEAAAVTSGNAERLFGWAGGA
jgi:TatD DNase family protein